MATLGNTAPTYSSSPGIPWTNISNLSALTLTEPKLSFNVMPYPSVKITVRKVLCRIVPCIIMVLLKILSNTTPRNHCKPLIPPYLPWYLWVSTPERKKPYPWILCPTMLRKSQWMLICQCERKKKKGVARKSRFTTNAKITPVAWLKIRDVLCAPKKWS